jgi:hypothetical protein
MGLDGLTTGLIILATGCSLGMFIFDFAVAPTWNMLGSARLKEGVIGSFWAAGEILIILNVFVFFHKTPEFVYRAF